MGVDASGRAVPDAEVVLLDGKCLLANRLER